MKTGNNIRQRQDGRFEARYQKGRDAAGHIVYGCCYGSTYEEAEKKRSEIIGRKNEIRQLNLLILGAGDHGMEVYDLVKTLRVFGKIAFLDDNKTDFAGVIGLCRDFSEYCCEYPVAIPAVGDSALRHRWITELTDAGFIIPTFIHPTATVAGSAKIGVGTVVCAGATVGHNVVIGKGCIIDSGAVVERNAQVPDWTLVNCGEIFNCVC